MTEMELVGATGITAEADEGPGAPAAAAASTTPTQQFVADANGIVRTKDERGRSIGVKKLSPLDRMRLFKALGGQLSANEVYMGYAALAASVTEIDGEPVAPPITERQLEAMVSRLGDEGLNAVGAAVKSYFGVVDEDEVAGTAKN
jgi:hypothetical protein